MAPGDTPGTVVRATLPYPLYRNMILSDRTIREQLATGRIVIDPFDPSCVQPSSVDVRLDHQFLVFRNHSRGYIDLKDNLEDLTELVEMPDGAPFVLHPGEFVLGSTLERVRVPDDLVGRIEGKSSLGRLGVVVHSTAGYIDAGFDGQVTLELSNVATLPITLYPQMKVAQISFHQMTTPAERPYGSGGLGSKYQGQRGPRPSRYWENFARRTGTAPLRPARARAAVEHPGADGPRPASSGVGGRARFRWRDRRRSRSG